VNLLCIRAILVSTVPTRLLQGRIFRALILAAGVVGLLLANVAFAQSSVSDNALQSTVWPWMYSVTDQDGSVRPVDRDRYTITFGADGTLSVRADCNQVSGTYRRLGAG
jgi:heat shock protein HslJ